jgi:hypothetical protein
MRRAARINFMMDEERNGSGDVWEITSGWRRSRRGMTREFVSGESEYSAVRAGSYEQSRSLRKIASVNPRHHARLLFSS